jgi:nucleoside-diphosphate-sugar epimerase
MYIISTHFDNFVYPDWMPPCCHDGRMFGHKLMERTMQNDRTALVIGATGGIGGEVAAALLADGWRVRGLSRTPGRAQARSEIAWVTGNAMNFEDVRRAAEGATLIVHAANPAGYRDWDKLVLPMLDNTIAAARAVGARILLPGTIYNYGPDAFTMLREDSPQHPLTRKGSIRVEMERTLQQAAQEGVPVLIVRAGDFFGPHSGNSWFSQGLVKPGKPVRSIMYPGKPDIGHAWAYLPDLAEAMVRLVELGDRLERFATYHFAGHWDADGTQMIAAIRRAVGNPDLPVRRFPWALATLLSPFVTLFREMRELRYLWQQPLRLNNSSLLQAIGTEPHTPLNEAVRKTLLGLNCLETDVARPVSELLGAASPDTDDYDRRPRVQLSLAA